MRQIQRGGKRDTYTARGGTDRETQNEDRYRRKGERYKNKDMRVMRGSESERQYKETQRRAYDTRLTQRGGPPLRAQRDILQCFAGNRQGGVRRTSTAGF